MRVLVVARVLGQIEGVQILDSHQPVARANEICNVALSEGNALRRGANKRFDQRDRPVVANGILGEDPVEDGLVAGDGLRDGVLGGVGVEAAVGEVDDLERERDGEALRQHVRNGEEGATGAAAERERLDVDGVAQRGAERVGRRRVELGRLGDDDRVEVDLAEDGADEEPAPEIVVGRGEKFLGRVGRKSLEGKIEGVKLTVFDDCGSVVVVTHVDCVFFFFFF